MIRHHLSAHPITELRAVSPTGGDAGAFKPSGLWYEIDGDWRRWCESEMPDWIKGKLLYRVELDGERMLKIENLSQFDEFHREYTMPLHPQIATVVPNWKRLADEGFDGIEIAPYLWERRLGQDTLWYYGWDCASGVIWTPRKARLVLEGKT